MARSDGYNTKTRQLILDYLINNRQHAVSASNILEHLEEQGASPNPTTVYRYLDKLAGELTDTMQMCGAHTLAEITPDMVRV
mgnify:CR=1 FL=1